MSEVALEPVQSEDVKPSRSRKPKYVPERDRVKMRFYMRRKRQSKLPHYPEP